MLGVSEDEDGWKSVRPFVAREKVNYRMVIASELVSQQYGGIEQLAHHFPDRPGGPRRQLAPGPGEHEHLPQEILTLLGGPKNEKNPRGF